MQYTGPYNFKVTLNIYDCMTRDYSTMRTVSTMCHLMRHIILIAAIFQIMPSCFDGSGTTDPLLAITQGVADSTLTFRQTQSACASVKHAKLGTPFHCACFAYTRAVFPKKQSMSGWWMTSLQDHAAFMLWDVETTRINHKKQQETCI